MTRQSVIPVELVHHHRAPLLGRRSEKANDEDEHEGVHGGHREGQGGADHLPAAATLCIQVGVSGTFVLGMGSIGVFLWPRSENDCFRSWTSYLDSRRGGWRR